MKRTPITLDIPLFPEEFHPLLQGAVLYDSSCSPTARVYYVEKDEGYYIKTAPAGTLKTEAELTRFFHTRNLAAEVLGYIPGEKDWLLTRRVPGEDCLHPQYLDDPKRLCDTLARTLRKLHDTAPTGCPVPDRNETYFATAARNYQKGCFDTSLFPDSRLFSSAEEAWQIAEASREYLKADVLLHGDFCLPNVMLNNWQFSGLIDLGNGGVGDRHIDLFWGIWSLQFNLKTSAYAQRFLDAYGRELVEPGKLRAIAAFEVFGE